MLDMRKDARKEKVRSMKESQGPGERCGRVMSVTNIVQHQKGCSATVGPGRESSP